MFALLGFNLALVQFLLSIPVISPFWNVNVYLISLYLRSRNLFSILQGLIAEFPLCLRGDFGLGLLSNAKE
jgi:hypothetical protein